MTRRRFKILRMLQRRTRRTETLCNEALNISDRIVEDVATAFRLSEEVLKNLEETRFEAWKASKDPELSQEAFEVLSELPYNLGESQRLLAQTSTTLHIMRMASTVDLSFSCYSGLSQISSARTALERLTN